ncbi:MAG: response regulator [Gammaproteobacteria bacterium]
MLKGEMDFLARSTSGSCGFTLLMTILLCGGLWPYVPLAVNVGWGVYMLVLTSARFLHARRYLARERGIDEARRFRRGVVTGTLASGFGWGSAAVVLFPAEHLAHQNFLAFALAGTTAAAITLQAPLKWALRVSLGLTLVPLAAMHFIQADPAHVATGFLVVLYTGLMFRFTALANATLSNALTLRDRNNTLIEKLRAAKAHTEQINADLKSEIAVRSRTEASLIEARDRAEQAARAKSEFLATMSHEIRTPMNGVLGMTELLSETELDNKQMRFVDTIQRSGRALLAIINDILDYSKIEAGKLEIESADFDLRNLVEETMVFFAEQAQRKQIELVTDLPPAQHAAFRGDPERIRQILMNLLGNALKFTQTGSVTLRVETLEETADSAKLIFAVSDTGTGIAPEHQKHIFESFQQADSSTTRKFGGTGLGLAICRRLVELMGGKIGVDSQPEVGSTFWFTVPLTPLAETDTGEATLAEHGSIAGLRVLVVDDNEASREMLEKQLLAWRARVFATGGAGRAIKCLAKARKINKPFDVVIYDHGVDGTDGVALARQIREDEANRDLRLVLLTAIDMLEQTGQWFSLGIDNYISKPVRQAELREALAAAIRQGGSTRTGAAVAADAPAPEDNIGAHVLLAEDNPVNQELALLVLEQLGCTAVSVTNGREAYEALAESPLDSLRSPYDIVLMDCQMPELDGFEATQRIRAWESERGDGRRIPIIALTANALQSDRERCLEAGMNDYVTKPFSREQLATALRRWITVDASVRQLEDTLSGRKDAVSAGGAESNEQPARAADLDTSALNGIRALQQEGGPDVLGRVIGMYFDSAPPLLTAMRGAAGSGDADALRASAHSLKSSSANLGAARLAELCQQLEQRGREGRLDDLDALLGTAELEFEAVLTALNAELGAKAA